MVLSLTPRELVAQLVVLPRDAGTGRLALPRSLASVLSQPARSYGDRAQGVIEYRLLGALAVSGWSLRRGLAAALLLGWPGLARSQAGLVQSGVLKRAYATLRDAGLWEERVVRVAGRGCSLVRLSPRSRELLGEAGVTCIESEWERMERAHRGKTESQLPHTAACCAFAYHARRYGYRTKLAPEVAGPSEPDVVLARLSDERRFYVEVQRRGGELTKRRVKWINLAGLQGFVAVCGERHADAERYREEAKSLGLAGGYLTDLSTLHWADLCGEPGDLPAGKTPYAVGGAVGDSREALPLDVWTHYWVGAQDPQPYDPAHD